MEKVVPFIRVARAVPRGERGEGVYDAVNEQCNDTAPSRAMARISNILHQVSFSRILLIAVTLLQESRRIN